jgi:hypothetical protein
MKLDLEVKMRVREILSVIKQIAPGKSVELRIPPYAAIQCVTGVAHRRGTPPNVVEMNAEALIKLIDNPDQWFEMCKQGLISASGTNSDISKLLEHASKILINPDRNLNG